MKKFAVNNAPLYLRVKDVLLEAIRSGEIVVDGRLLSEETLTKQFNVSRATIRSALQLLEKDGIISKRHGSGTIVNTEGLQVKIRIDEFKGFFELIRESGHTPSIGEKKLLEVQLEKKICDVLDLDNGSKGLLLQRLFWGDGKPLIYAKEYIPFSILRERPTIEEVPESIFELADSYCTDPVSYSITEISSTIADKKLKQLMELPGNETLIRLEEIHYSRVNQPLMYSDILVRDSIIRFHAVRIRK